MKSPNSEISLLLVGFIFANFVVTSVANQPNKASFEGLADLPGGFCWSKSYGVSADGSVVVGDSTPTGSTAISLETACTMVIRGSKSQGGPTEATRWTKSGDIVSLGYLLAGDFGSNAYGVSADGSVVVGRSYSASSLKAFRWTKSEGMVGLGYLPDVNDSNDLKSSSIAYDISGDGAVVVGSVRSKLGKQPFRWTKSGGVEGLGNLPGGYFWGEARGVSADGSVVVGVSSSASGKKAFRWTKSGGMVGLGDLPGGKFSSEAYAVSADGSVVVGRSISELGGEAFRWTASEGMRGLGDLRSQNFRSWAYDVSGDGTTVVGMGCSGPVGHENIEAFIWDAKHGMRSLKDVLINDYGMNLTGWMLEKARGISDDGLTIVGEGVNPNGIPKGWIATIPKPATALKSPQPISGCE